MNQNLMVEGVWDKDEYGNWYLKNKKTGDIIQITKNFYDGGMLNEDTSRNLYSTG
jgi:hypothetical protein